MGLFSGGFLGSGSDESKTNTTTTTTVETTTTTNIRDVGLTGAQAVDLANVVSSNVAAASVEAQKNVGDTAEALYQGVGNNYNQLIGGANDLILTGAAQNIEQGKTGADILGTASQLISNVQDRGIQFLNDLGVRQSESQAQLLTVQQDATNPALSLAKGSQNIIILAIIGMALVFIVQKGV